MCGTSDAPYIPTRILNLPAVDEMNNFRLVSRVIPSFTCLPEFHVDDVLTEANNLTQTQELQIQLIQLIARGGIVLHRWYGMNF